MPAKPLFILLADDDLEDLELFEEIILSIAPETLVKHVFNGKALLDVLEGYSDDELPHLIILDYNMPQVTGVDALARLNAQSRYGSVVKLILSTSRSQIHIKECLKNGAKDYFVKPDNIRELEVLVKKMLSMCAVR